MCLIFQEKSKIKTSEEDKSGHCLFLKLWMVTSWYYVSNFCNFKWLQSSIKSRRGKCSIFSALFQISHCGCCSFIPTLKVRLLGRKSRGPSLLSRLTQRASSSSVSPVLVQAPGSATEELTISRNVTGIILFKNQNPNAHVDYLRVLN